MGERIDGLTVQRWRKYGKDRLYVSDAAGQRVGWVDLLTGERHLERVELAAAFAAAVESHGGGAPAAVASEVGSVPEQRVAPAAEPAWEDLAIRRPGEGVRAEAQAQLAAAREAAPVLTFARRLLNVHTDERAFRVGADGEESVGARLEKLTDRGWRVLHSVPVGKRHSDIDHILIGPGGVYTINTKNHPGKSVWVGRNTIMVGGHKTAYLRNSRFEAERAARLLAGPFGSAVPVRAVLVILTGTLIPDITIKQMPEDVLVLDRMDVPRVFKKAPTRLQPDEVERLFEIARRSTTWTA
jgi:hypothetical protein